MEADAHCQPVTVESHKTGANVLAAYKKLSTPTNWPPEKTRKDSKPQYENKGPPTSGTTAVSGFVRTKPAYRQSYCCDIQLKILAYAVCLTTAGKTGASIVDAIPIDNGRRVV